MSPVQNLNKYTMFHLQCDIALRNPVLQNKSTVVYMSTALYIVFLAQIVNFVMLTLLKVIVLFSFINIVIINNLFYVIMSHKIINDNFTTFDKKNLFFIFVIKSQY